MSLNRPEKEEKNGNGDQGCIYFCTDDQVAEGKRHQKQVKQKMVVGKILGINRKGQFTQQDIDILHQHPIKGRDMILQLGEDFQWLANVVHQEHEREDGSGYPQALPGDQIHEYAKIIGVADVYAGLTRSRADRRGLLPFEAVKDILQTRKPEFDNRIIRILLNTLSAFPIGSLIKLNSGAIGRVIETDSDSPLRPVIEIEFDPEGRPVHEKRRILLREHPVLHITDTVDPEDLVRQ